MRNGAMLVRLIVLFLCMGLGVELPVTGAQSPKSSPWHIPPFNCAEGCFGRYRLDPPGNLYAYLERPHQATLQVVERGTSTVAEYDLFSMYPGKGIRRDFVPLAGHRLLLFDVQADQPFALLDLGTGHATPLAVDIPSNVQECDVHAVLTGKRTLYTLGDENDVIFCSRVADISYLHIAHLENSTLHVESTLEMGPSETPERYTPPWLAVSGGLDGNVYVLASPHNRILNRLAPQWVEAFHYSVYLVLRYTPDTRTWDFVRIEASSERWNVQGSDTFSPLVGVDETGNLYFLNTRVRKGSETSDLVKYDAQGEKVWHVTENDFNGRWFYEALLVGEDALVLNFGDGNLQYFEYDVSAP